MCQSFYIRLIDESQTKTAIRQYLCDVESYQGQLCKRSLNEDSDNEICQEDFHPSGKNHESAVLGLFQKWAIH